MQQNVCVSSTSNYPLTLFLLVSLRKPETPSLAIMTLLSVRLGAYVEFYQRHLLLPLQHTASLEMKVVADWLQLYEITECLVYSGRS